MSFAERIRRAADFEDLVVVRLNETGWRAFRFGQALLPAEARELLKRFEDSSRRPCLIRWMPDVIAFRTYASGKVYVALIDAKVCDGARYAVEMSASETAEAFTDELYTPSFFVFDDWKVLTPREVRQRGVPGPTKSNGSGTPYVLVEKRYGRDFDVIFPPVRQGVA